VRNEDRYNAIEIFRRFCFGNFIYYESIRPKEEKRPKIIFGNASRVYLTSGRAPILGRRRALLEVPEVLWMLVPVARCRQCNQFYWLINEQMYMPGCAPERFRGESVTFICCDYVQYVSGKDVKYMAMSVVIASA
jgi:hypothetical protein